MQLSAEMPAHYVWGQTQGPSLLSQGNHLVAELQLDNSADEQHLFTKWTLQTMGSFQPQLGSPPLKFVSVVEITLAVVKFIAWGSG